MPFYRRIFFTSSYVFVIESLYQQIGVISLKKSVELSFFYNLNLIKTLYQAYMFQTERNLQTGSQD